MFSEIADTLSKVKLDAKECGIMKENKNKQPETNYGSARTDY